MPISPNLTRGVLGGRLAFGAATEPAAPAAPPAPPAPSLGIPVPQPTVAPAFPFGTGTSPFGGGPLTGVGLGFDRVPPVVPSPPVAPPAPPPATPPVLTATVIAPELLATLSVPPRVYVPPPPKTTTQLARGAISQLSQLAPPQVRRAMNTVVNAGLNGEKLMTHLEQYVRVGEVLNELAARWSEATRTAFISAMRTQADQIDNDVMDAIVSLAILGDNDLDPELKLENTPETTAEELTNRKVVWQSIAPGAALQPPYVIVVAVEYTDVVKAEEAVKAITGGLVMRDGFRMPREIADRV